jgi:hypothetical protein
VTARLNAEAILQKIRVPEKERVLELEAVLEKAKDPVFGDRSMSLDKLQRVIDACKELEEAVKAFRALT